MTSQAGKHWDIFCKIVDNYGDIGVCWRLSQQLANEFSIYVRLFIDDVHVAQKIIPNLDINKPQQIINQVQIWQSSIASQISIDEVDVVIETFGCELPAQYLQQMSSETLWINLEYLSAEKWVSDFHAKPSKHPTLPLTKYYFFPGFVEDTGGLIRERDLIKQRDDFIVSQEIQNDFWQRITRENINAQNINFKNIKLSLFYYPQAQIKSLIEGLQDTNQAISIFIPFNTTIKEFSNIFPDFKCNIDEVYQHKNLTFYVLPFLSQTDYDQLLWSCDFNFVRGEDSWIRAIWAGKPFIWQPYIQADDVHLNKLKAFLHLYTSNASPEMKILIDQAHLNWSGYKDSHHITDIWPQLISQLSQQAQHSKSLSKQLSHQTDLATKLVIFSENLIKNQV